MQNKISWNDPEPLFSKKLLNLYRNWTLLKNLLNLNRKGIALKISEKNFGLVYLSEIQGTLGYIQLNSRHTIAFLIFNGLNFVDFLPLGYNFAATFLFLFKNVIYLWPSSQSYFSPLFYSFLVKPLGTESIKSFFQLNRNLNLNRMSKKISLNFIFYFYKNISWSVTPTLFFTVQHPGKTQILSMFVYLCIG